MAKDKEKESSIVFVGVMFAVFGLMLLAKMDYYFAMLIAVGIGLTASGIYELYYFFMGKGKVFSGILITGMAFSYIYGSPAIFWIGFGIALLTLLMIELSLRTLKIKKKIKKEEEKEKKKKMEMIIEELGV